MLKKTITFTDYNGVKRTEDFYFNLNKAELMSMEIGTTGGLTELIQTVVAKQDGPAILHLWQDFILKAYGEKSPDGRQFIKNDTVRENFAQTEAYAELFMELATSAEAAANFIKGLVPADLADSIDIPSLPAQ